MNENRTPKINRREFLEWSSLATTSALLGVANILTRSAEADETPVNRSRPEFSPYSFEHLGERFTFAIIGDSHILPRSKPGAPCYDEYYQAAVREIAASKPTPAFIIVVGDVVHAPYDDYFSVALELSSESKVPVLWVHGNHDGTAQMPPLFAKYQKQLNGYEKLYGSFNAGNWHFLWIPDECQLVSAPLAQEVFAWMEQDLQVNRNRPTMLFVHRHLLPVGLTQLEYYAFSMANRDRILDLIFKHGNVKEVFSGHVHNGIKDSIGSAWQYRGANFVLSPTIHQPRDMGKMEEFPEYMPRYMGREKRGGFYLLVDVDGNKVTNLRGRCVGIAGEHVYPQQFEQFDPAFDPRWEKSFGQLMPRTELVNGDFEDGLTGWAMPYRYQAEKLPLYEWKVSDDTAASGKKSVYLLCRSARNLSAGDDATLELYQAVALSAGVRPVLKASYRPEQTSPFGGGYIRLTGYAKTEPKLRMMFHWGRQEEQSAVMIETTGFAELGRPMDRRAFDTLYRRKEAFFWNLADSPGQWHDLQVDMAELYEQVLQGQRQFADLALDKVILICGAWSGHTGEKDLEVDDQYVWHPKGTPFDQGVYFDSFSLDLGKTSLAALTSANDGKPLETRIAQLKPVFGHAIRTKKT